MHAVLLTIQCSVSQPPVHAQDYVVIIVYQHVVCYWTILLVRGKFQLRNAGVSAIIMPVNGL